MPFLYLDSVPNQNCVRRSPRESGEAYQFMSRVVVLGNGRYLCEELPSGRCFWAIGRRQNCRSDPAVGVSSRDAGDFFI